jgi:hypothetical protein
MMSWTVPQPTAARMDLSRSGSLKDLSRSSYLAVSPEPHHVHLPAGKALNLVQNILSLPEQCLTNLECTPLLA